MLETKHLAFLTELERRGQSDSGELALCFQVLSLASAIDQDCASRLAPLGLSEGRFVLLFLLRGAETALSPHQLAERAGVTRATITGLLDGLERDGYLARHHDAKDRRKVSVRLSVKGQTLADQLFDEHSRWIASLFAALDAQERALLGGLLQRVWRTLDNPVADSNVEETGISP